MQTIPFLVAQSLDIAGWTQLLKDVGIVGMLVLVLSGLYFRKIYFAWQYMEMREDRDFWRRAALSSHETTKDALGTISTIARNT